MALFSRKQKNDAVIPAVKEKASVGAAAAHTVSAGDHAHVLLRPRITEKATLVTGMSIYVFDVVSSANKRQVLEAVAHYYKVTPRKVRIVTIPSKSVRNMRTGQSGTSHGGKKAYVYLKKGETISTF